MKEYVQTNAFFTHSEQVLLTMICDTDINIRNKAVDIIFSIRQLDASKCKVVKVDGIRKYRIPELNFGADSYTNIIDLDIPTCTEPPLTKKLSDTELFSIRTTPLIPPTYPNHSQSVERLVKVVSESASKFYGKPELHKLIISKQAAKEERPAYESKKDYKSKK